MESHASFSRISEHSAIPSSVEKTAGAKFELTPRLKSLEAIAEEKYNAMVEKAERLDNSKMYFTSDATDFLKASRMVTDIVLRSAAQQAANDDRYGVTDGVAA